MTILRYEIFSAIAVKENIIRFVVEVFDGDLLVAEYEPVVHTHDFTLLITNGDVDEMQIDLGALQEKLVADINKMNITAGVAKALINANLKWDVNVDDGLSTDSNSE